MSMLEKDLDILDKILRDLNITPTYREILLSGLVKKLEDYNMDRLSRNFIYVALAHDEGKSFASEVADYWEEMKQTGSYKTNLQKTLEKSPTFSKFVK
jgi:hypothetical protein